MITLREAWAISDAWEMLKTGQHYEGECDEQWTPTQYATQRKILLGCGLAIILTTYDGTGKAPKGMRVVENDNCKLIGAVRKLNVTGNTMVFGLKSGVSLMVDVTGGDE